MKKFKENILTLGLNPKKELAIIICVNIILIITAGLTYWFLRDILFPLTIVGVDVGFNILFVGRYTKQIGNIKQQNLQDFAIIFGYFRIYIHNGYSVYSALKEITNFANHDLRKSLELLIEEIDQDKSVQPFIKFGKQFNEIIIEEMMISIYQLIDDGETSDYLLQFELIFDKFSDLLYQKNLRNKDSKLGTICSSPLVGSCFLMIILTVGIIGVIGELINGI